MAYNPRSVPWTAEEDRQLRILWGAGCSSLEIAAIIGRTKSAVLGRRFRLGLPERESAIIVTVCPDKVFRFRREVEAGNDAAREAIARAA